MTGRTRPEAVRWGCHVHRTPAGTPCQHCAAQGELFPRTDAVADVRTMRSQLVPYCALGVLGRQVFGLLSEQTLNNRDLVFGHLV